MAKTPLLLCLIGFFPVPIAAAQEDPRAELLKIISGKEDAPAVFAWEPQASGAEASLRGLCAIGGKAAWASGTGGTWLRTTDGGSTWQVGRVPGAEDLDFRDVQAFSTDAALLMSAGRPAKIFKTTDGGRTWRERYHNNSEGVFLDSMAFWDENNGIAVGDPLGGGFLVLLTSDGGETWERAPAESIPAPVPGEAMFAASGACVAALGDGLAWFATGGSAARVFRSTDRGRSWIAVETGMLHGEGSQGVFSIAFHDPRNGIIVGGDYQDPERAELNAALSADGGAAWQVPPSALPQGYRSCVAYLPGSGGRRLVAVGTSGSDFSIDGGRTWVRFDGTAYNGVVFAPDGAGWAVGPEGRVAAFRNSRKRGCEFAQYREIKDRLARGWNTWDSRGVLRHVLLPQGFALNLAFKQHRWIDEQYLRSALIGREGEGEPSIRPGPHATDGAYTRLEIRWGQLEAVVESARAGEDLVLLVTPLSAPEMPVKLVVESGMLWNRPGGLTKEEDSLKADLPGAVVRVFCTAGHVEDPYVDTLTPYLSVFLEGPVAVSTGEPRSLEEVRGIVEAAAAEVKRKAAGYGELADTFIAMQAGLAWNLVYEPRLDRVVHTVGRLWNEEYGGYCLFGWDNFFMAYVAALESRDLAYAGVLEHLRGRTDEGFIPNDNQGNGRRTWDHSQPPVGALMVREIYRIFPEKWFLEATFDDLLAWNRWYWSKRRNGGLLAYGSHEAKNPFDMPGARTKTTAGYESGMDDSPMYEGVPFNAAKDTMELQDVGLNCLHIADCLALAEMAALLGREAERIELEQRAAVIKERMEGLWDEDFGLYLNRRTDTGELSRRLSPTLFYALLAGAPDAERARRIVDEHLLNPAEFWGDWVLPSTSRDDPSFPRQRYWKGAVWPPLNFLVYLGLRKYGMAEAHGELAARSLELFMREWERSGYVSENYSSITGTGDDSRLSSDRFHSWGTLMAVLAFIERGYLPGPEGALQGNN